MTRNMDGQSEIYVRDIWSEWVREKRERKSERER